MCWLSEQFFSVVYFIIHACLVMCIHRLNMAKGINGRHDMTFDLCLKERESLPYLIITTYIRESVNKKKLNIYRRYKKIETLITQ